MAEMEHYPNFQKDNYIHPKAAWDKLRMAGARRQNVYLYAATGYGKTELLHRYLRRRRHIWLSGKGLTVETLQEIALPAEATMVIDDLARVLDPAVRREIVSMLDQPGLWLVLAGRCPLPSWLTGPYVNGRLSVIPEEDLRLSEKEIAQLYLSWGVQLPRNLLEKHVSEVLGPYSKGLVSIGLAESLFEKGGNIYKVLELANRGLMEAMNGGKFELEFVGAALVARVYLVTGHPGDSVKTLEEIETRARQRGARRVVRNVRAMQSRIKLWQGRVEDAVRWMENEPQNEIYFNVLERYCYNTFVRVYMAQQRYDKTAQILMRLRSYANMEKRPWLQMEGDLLESIIRYRTGNPLWKTELTQVLRRAESYHFVRLFCREGAALLPLLQELGCPEGVDEAYWQEVLGETRAMAEAYPLYLSTNAPAALPGAVQLSERALQVLRLQDRGLTRSEIARQLQLSERSVKYQCEQAYHKLGTSNKVEALAAARKLNLL